MSADVFERSRSDLLRFETNPVVFELQRQGSKELQEVVLLVPKSFDVAQPVEVLVQPATTPNGFRFVADNPEAEVSDDPDEPNRLRVRVVCSGGTEGEEESATLTLSLQSGAKAQVRLLAGINHVLPLSQVLREEYEELLPDLAARFDAVLPAGQPASGVIDEDRDEKRSEDQREKERLRDLYAVLQADPNGLAAICFSGGGIRSATFNFGILQGLASLGLLDKFHYLSTVSGGGYIGGWLSSWLHRAGSDSVMPVLAKPRPDPERPEPEPIRHLRQYSNYLTPKLGIFSADSWTVASIVIRNLLLNALVLVPLLAALLTLPLLALARLPAAWALPTEPNRLFYLAFAFGTIGLFFENLLRASAVPRPGEKSPRWTRWFLPLGLVPLLVGTAFLILAVDRFNEAGLFPFGSVLPRCAVWAIGMPLLAYLAAFVLQKPLLGRRQASLGSDLFALIAGGTVITFVYAGILSKWAPHLVEANLYLYPILGPGLVLGPLLLGKTLFIAFSSPAEEYGTGRSAEHADADREWWARWSAWILIATVGWILGSALVYFAPFLVGETKARIAAWLSAAGGLGVLTSLLGKSSQTNKDGNETSPWRRWALALAAPLFCVVFLVVIAAGTQGLLNRLFPPETQATGSYKPMIASAVREKAPGATAEAAPGDGEAVKKKDGGLLTRPADNPPFLGQLWQVVVAIGALFGLGSLMGYFVNVNRFSLQGMYRNRLVRAYLGASNPRRRPNLFTGFDTRDNLRLHALRTNRPFHVVNMALNLVAGKDLAWQQRKAESFTATPLHCGAANLGYRRSQVYGGPHGISLGTAVATSGAAASPNMGHSSSAPVTFIMTLFNARLGIWLGNPGKLGRKAVPRSGPLLSGHVVFEEALGLTDSSHPYVNLSDGGHFENLGLYEMVRRRCRFIVVCDAGCDPNYSFDDLGNAIRKVRIDLGIHIEFEDRIHIFSKAGDGVKVTDDARYCALGKIHYQGVDGPGAPTGTVLYIKPAICDTEPYDVTNYSRASATFPHETTADQWFSESQFESYRALGRAALLKMAGGPVSDLAAFEQRVKTYVCRARPGLPKVEVILPAGLLATGSPPAPPENGGGDTVA